MSEYILLITPRQPRFTKAQLQTFVDASVNAGSVCFGSILIPAILNNIFVPLNIISSLAGVIMFWTLAVITAKYIPDE